MDRSNRLRRVPFKALQRVMESLGYVGQPIEGHRIVFTHPRRSLFVVIPGLQEDNNVRPIDLLSIRNTLINDGVIRDDEEFESLFRIKKGDQLVWTNPMIGQQIQVLAASNETSDGMVTIKQNGAFMPCHVSQLIRVEDLEEAAGGR